MRRNQKRAHYNFCSYILTLGFGLLMSCAGPYTPFGYEATKIDDVLNLAHYRSLTREEENKYNQYREIASIPSEKIKSVHFHPKTIEYLSPHQIMIIIEASENLSSVDIESLKNEIYINYNDKLIKLKSIASELRVQDSQIKVKTRKLKINPDTNNNIEFLHINKKNKATFRWEYPRPFCKNMDEVYNALKAYDRTAFDPNKIKHIDKYWNSSHHRRILDINLNKSSLSKDLAFKLNKEIFIASYFYDPETVRRNIQINESNWKKGEGLDQFSRTKEIIKNYCRTLANNSNTEQLTANIGI